MITSTIIEPVISIILTMDRTTSTKNHDTTDKESRE